MEVVAPKMDHSLSSSSSSYCFDSDDSSLPLELPLMRSRRLGKHTSLSLFAAVTSIFRSFIPSLQTIFLPSCKWLSMPVTVPMSPSPSRKKITGTFFGNKRGRVSFAVQEDPRSEPMLLLELAMPTSHLVKEMASGMVRILLECELASNNNINMHKKKRALSRCLWDEPTWTMYCNGHRRGFAVSRQCTVSDLHVLGAVKTVSVGAGVLPAVMGNALEMGKGSGNYSGAVFDGSLGGEVMYMRAKFERVVGSKDSEALYMISPDCGRGKRFDNGGPELSLFLLRI
ncbi:protein MIZU-KUSSEI 1-like [Dioscorea cayenensis subsp. rotundata]|uniref:Protein MIZU-KUSSEI 1-like n=1 Tax=Dioscorea cayennensis subsp. rotundata TaxID=55577 RepID=A0AB40CE94_DIOCR|nr:protein MIZU-KUSSEI 1-like [Dioscorea cayenensis subsp. rotundata]